jgi:hypothetical protein
MNVSIKNQLMQLINQQPTVLFQSKIVIEVLMRCEKCRSKAMQIAASTEGMS